MSDDPSIQSVCGGPPVPLSELLALKGVFLPSEDAEHIVGLGDVVLPLLLSALDSEDWSVVIAAANLLGALGNPQAVGPLAECLSELDVVFNPDAPLDHDTMLAEALACLGPAGVHALEELAHPDQEDFIRRAAVEGLALAHAPGTDDLLIRLFQQEEDAFVCGLLAHTLCGRQHPQAIPLVSAALEAGRLDPLLFRPIDLQEWQAGTMGDIRESWSPQPLGYFLPAHRAEFQRVEYDLLCQSEWEAARWDGPEFCRDWESFRNSLAPSVPCPCGSGQAERTCCQPWQARLAHIDWRQAGYRWLPSEQYRDLPRADFAQHVMLLGATADELRRDIDTLQSDYLRWAAAVRCRQLDMELQEIRLATAIALSPGPRHPVLDYEHIHAVARVRNRRQLDDWVQARHLAHAWQWCIPLWKDVPAQMDGFQAILAAEPHFLWSAVAMAEVLDFPHADLVLPVLRDAVAKAHAGMSKGLPGLAEEPCPAWVLERYLHDFENPGPRLRYRDHRLLDTRRL